MQAERTADIPPESTAARIAAAILIGAPLLEIAGMAHHPTVAAHGAAQLVAGLRANAQLSATVHGLLIVLLLAVLGALLEFSRARGLSRPAVRQALLAYGLGSLLMTGAALVSGFITPRVAGLGGDIGVPDATLVLHLSGFAMLFNQAFARAGAILMSVGIGLWSVDLLRERAWLLGGLGLVCGGVCAVGIASGLLRLDVHGMMVVTDLQAAWTVGAGGRLWRAA